MKRSRARLGKQLDPGLTERVERIFLGENLTEIVLHAHLLIERALTGFLSEKFARPNVLWEVQWSFHQKCSLYIGLYDPEPAAIRRLQGFNRLRNAIAHGLDVDIEASVAKYLVFEKQRPEDSEPIPPENALDHVRVMAGMILMMDLGAIRGWSREPVDWEEWDREIAERFGDLREPHPDEDLDDNF